MFTVGVVGGVTNDGDSGVCGLTGAPSSGTGRSGFAVSAAQLVLDHSIQLVVFVLVLQLALDNNSVQLLQAWEEPVKQLKKTL